MPTAFYNAADYMTGGATEEDALIAADAAATSDGGGVVLIPSAIVVTATTSFTVENPLMLMGGVIRPNSGVSVIVEKAIDPGAVQWIDLTNGGKVILRHFARLDWWGPGASGSHSTADQTANYAALRAAYTAFDGQGGVVEFQGTVVVGVRDSNGFVVPITEPNVTLRPRDDNAEFMLANGVVDGSGFDLTVFRTLSNVRGLRFERFRWNGNGTNNLLPSGTGSTKPNLQLHVFEFAEGDDVYIDCIAENHSGARVVRLGSGVTRPKRAFVRVRAHNIADAVPGNVHSVDHTTVWMRTEGGVADVEVTNDTMAATGTALEFHGFRETGRISCKRIRYAYLPVAVLADSIGCRVSEILCDEVQCAVSAYIGSSFKLRHRIDSIVGTQADEVYGFIDDDTVTGGLADGSELSIGSVSYENLAVSPVDLEAFGLRAGKFPGRIHVESLSGKNAPCALIGSVNPVTADATEVAVDHYIADNCGRTSHATTGIDHAIWFLSGNRLKSLKLGNGTLRGTMAGWAYLDIPVGDLDLGAVDPGAIPPLIATGGNYSVDRTPGYRLRVSGNIAPGSEYDIGLTSKSGAIRIVAVGATKHVAAVFTLGTIATSPKVFHAEPAADVANSDSLGDLCLFWNAGQLRIKNHLGESVDFIAVAEWT